jgi:ATP-dependent RNA helicase SUPV3L1/SUV3
MSQQYVARGDEIAGHSADDTEVEIEALLKAHHATLVRGNGTVSISFQGCVPALDEQLPYHLIAEHGRLGSAKKWSKTSPENRLDRIRAQLTVQSSEAFRQIVQAFVAEAILRAQKSGVNPRNGLSALVCTSEAAEKRFQIVIDRIDNQGRKTLETQATQKTRDSFDLARYPESFTLAASIPRRLIGLLGPTNSGKTHEAMQILQQAQSGVYLAPLRLLALENYERLREAGVCVNLITGEERRLSENATHVASTVEMLDSKTRVEVAIIDEIQMLADSDRGAAWTAAVCAVPADTVYLLGSLTARGALEAFARRLGCPLELRELPRKNALEIEAAPVGSLKALRKGDAVIVFSRRDVLYWANELTGAGFSVATIYGNLSPEVRQAQAQAFREGQADILVATDAIGMGLNLPISRVVFTTAKKYDGHIEDRIPAWLAQQIAGRAGRFGICDKGLVGGFDPETHRTIRKLINTTPRKLARTGFYVAPSLEHLKQICELTGEQRLSQLLTLFQRNINLNDEFFVPTGMTEQIERAQSLDARAALSLEERYTLSLLPLNLRVAAMSSLFNTWANNVARQVPSGVGPKWFGEGPAVLQAAEDACKQYSAYAWLSYRLPQLFPDGGKAIEFSREASLAVNRMLQEHNKRRRGVAEQHVSNRSRRSRPKIRRRPPF